MRSVLALSVVFWPCAFLTGCRLSTPPLERESLSANVHGSLTGNCYQLVDGGEHLPTGFSPSLVILLDSVPVAQVLTADSIAWPATMLSSWSTDAKDGNLIHVWLSNGFERTGLALRRTADTLVGSVRRFADFPRVYLSHRARAIRVRCPE
jgi:hypothetical protein